MELFYKAVNNIRMSNGTMYIIICLSLGLVVQQWVIHGHHYNPIKRVFKSVIPDRFELPEDFSPVDHSMHFSSWMQYDVSTDSPPNQPSQTVLSSVDVESSNRKKQGYEGGNDALHLGGNLKNDTQTFEPELWTWMISKDLGIESVLDVGCGRGVSTKWFKDKGIDTLCVEGSPEAVKKSFVPENVVSHDYTLGPWWPEKIYDAAWSCEFLEHVDIESAENYMTTFAKARFLFVSHAVWGGWHHVAVRAEWWWIEFFRDFGFAYMPEMTRLARDKTVYLGMNHPTNPRGNSHFKFHGLVFRNLRYRFEAKRLGDYFVPRGRMTEESDE